MNVRVRLSPSDSGESIAARIRKRFAQIAVGLLVQAAVLFTAAGRLRWRAAWAYLGLYLSTIAVNAVILLPRDPELIAERSRLAENSRGWDRLLAGLLMVSSLATLITAGLEVRLGRTRRMARRVSMASAAAMVLGNGLVSWAMASNRFFSTMVRIQRERDHAVVSGGPYRYVRHPGYAGMITSSLATAPMLGSRWALMPAGITAILFVVRAALEDRTLREELEGYREYTRRVRYRLLPRIW